MECGLCKISYTPSERLPKMLPGCGHTFCSVCLASKLHSGVIVCPDCGKKGNHATIQSLPTNQVLLNLSGSPGKICPTHSKSLEAYCPETLTLLCVDCLLSKQYKGKILKNVDEAYKEAMESVARDSKSCEELIDKAQQYLGQHSNLREGLEASAIEQSKALDSLHSLLVSSLDRWKQKNLLKIEQNFSSKKEALEEWMKDLKNCQVEASDLEQDRYLDKLDLLKKTKARRETLVHCRKVLAAAESKRTTFDLGDFNARSELDAFVSEIRSQFEQHSRPTTSSGSAKNGAVSNNLMANKPSGKQAPVSYYKPSPKPELANLSVVAKKAPVAVPSNQRPKTAAAPTPAPAAIVPVQAPEKPGDKLADKRNEMKLLKNQGSGPSPAPAPVKPQPAVKQPAPLAPIDPQPKGSPPKPQKKDGYPPATQYKVA